jgi:hypothetical protein
MPPHRRVVFAPRATSSRSTRALGLAMLVSIGMTAAAQTPVPSKPLKAVECRPDERLVVEVAPVTDPYVYGVTRLTWLGWLGSFTLTDLAGIPASLKVKDQSASFKQGVSKALGSVDLQTSFLSRSRQALGSRPPCNVLVVTSAERKNLAMNSSDNYVGMSFFFGFQGERPVLNVSLGAAQIKGSARLAQVEGEAEKLKELVGEMQNGRAPDRKKLNELVAVTNGLGGLLDGLANFKSDSAPHSTEEWLAGGGVLVRSELDAAMDKLMAQAVATLFPEKK